MPAVITATVARKNAANIFTAQNTFRGAGGVRLEDASGAYGVTLTSRFGAVPTAGVPTLQPNTANFGCAFDIMPKGTVTTDQLGTGICWIDVCDTDLIASPAANWHAAGIAVRTDCVAFGSKAAGVSQLQTRLHGPVICFSDSLSADQFIRVNPYAAISTTAVMGGLSVWTSATGTTTWGTSNYGIYMGRATAISKYATRVLSPADGAVAIGRHAAGVAPTAQSDFADVAVFDMATGRVVLGVGATAAATLLDLYSGDLTFSTTTTGTPTKRTRADFLVTNTSNVEGSQKYALTWNCYDAGGARQIIRGEASGSAPLIGFLGQIAVARQSIGNAATDLATVITLANNLRTALNNFGLTTT